MPKYILIGLIDKPTKVLHKDMSMEKFLLLSLIMRQ